MSEHTAGPWMSFRMVDDVGEPLRGARAAHYVAGCVAAGAADADFFAVAQPGAGKPDVCHTGNGSTSAANARLIAAAPELLLALKRAKELLDCWDCGHAKNADCHEGNRCPSCLVVEDAEAAIRKATAR